MYFLTNENPYELSLFLRRHSKNVMSACTYIRYYYYLDLEINVLIRKSRGSILLQK